MLKNLNLKFFALFLATIFWVFVVSLENTFFQIPNEVPIQVFNQADDLALTENLGATKLTVRTSDSILLRKLSPNDFEAYVDLRDIGVGTHTLPVLVNSRNQQVSVIRAEPSEITLELSPVRSKIVTLLPVISGQPAASFSIESVTLLREFVTISGAESLLKKINSGKAQITLNGFEKENITKTAPVFIYDENGKIIEGLHVEPAFVEAALNISEAQASKEVSVRPRFSGGAAPSGQIEIVPAKVTVTGPGEKLRSLEFMETEEIDAKELEGGKEKKVKLAVPEGMEAEVKEVVIKIK